MRSIAFSVSVTLLMPSSFFDFGRFDLGVAARLAATGELQAGNQRVLQSLKSKCDAWD